MIEILLKSETIITFFLEPILALEGADCDQATVQIRNKTERVAGISVHHLF
jgi:hypothetical protein